MLALCLFLKVRVSMAVLLSTGPLHPPPPPPGGHELLASPRMPWDLFGLSEPLVQGPAHCSHSEPMRYSFRYGYGGGSPRRHINQFNFRALSGPSPAFLL